jgi:hypothetical protein
MEMVTVWRFNPVCAEKENEKQASVSHSYISFVHALPFPSFFELFVFYFFTMIHTCIHACIHHIRNVQI